MQNIFKNVEISNGEIILVSSDILKLLIKSKQNNEKLKPSMIIDMLIEKIGKNGTLLFPTYNWDFCRGIEFNYKKTKSYCGSLSNAALERKDFKRTRNPIYSFAVTGKDKNLICDMKHENCFSLDSPFGYLIKNKGKNLFIDLHYRKGGFTFVHIVEQKAGSSNRYFKKFQGFYTDEFNKRSKVIISMYVRNLEKKVGTTFINKKFDNILQKNNAYKEKEMLNTEIGSTIIDIQKAYDLLLDDTKRSGDLIYSTKIK